MTPYQQLARNDEIFETLSRRQPSLRFQISVFSVILLTILPVEVIAAFLTYKMTFDGQDTFLIAGLSLQAIASIGTLHVIKKLGGPAINTWIRRIAGIAFICFITGFGFIAATTSLKEVLINLMPDLGSSGIGLDGSQAGSSSKIASADAFNWFIPYAWYFAFTGLTLVLAFAAAEVLDRIMSVHAQLSDIKHKCANWKKMRKELDETQDHLDRLEAAKARWERDLDNAIQGHTQQILEAFDDGLSRGPRKLLQTVNAQSLHADPRQSVVVPVDAYRTAEINIPLLEKALKSAEASFDLNETQDVPQLSFDLEDRGEKK